MAEILFTTLVFSPDAVSTSVLLTQLGLELQGLGHKLTVATTTPHYNCDVDARRVQPLKRCWAGLLDESNCDGITVYHARVKAKGSRIIGRLFDYASFHFLSLCASLIKAPRWDIIFAPSPPLSIGLVAWLLSMRGGGGFIYNVQEIYPDIAVSLGVIRNRFLIRILFKLEMFVYRRARTVVVISEFFRKRLISKGVPESKLRVIPNFVDTEFIRPLDRKNAFSSHHGFDDSFVVLYAGNLGLTQSFESILGAAEGLRDLSELKFVLIGDGSRRDWLKSEVTRKGLENLLMLPYQPSSVVPDIYAACDLCVVPLKQGTAQGTFPSKIYTIMAAGRPVLVSADTDSELTWVVKEADCGWTVPPDDAKAMSEAVRHAYENRKEGLAKGESGRRYVVERHSKRTVALQYDALIRELTERESDVGTPEPR